MGGPICCTGPETPAGAFDQSDVEARDDVLVYSTPVLEKGIEVTGPIEAVLYVSSSARDTDFTTKLVDVYPDGKAYDIREGILRARYREGFDKKVWLTPEEVYELRINVGATSNYFAPGHRISARDIQQQFPPLRYGNGSPRTRRDVNGLNPYANNTRNVRSSVRGRNYAARWHSWTHLL